MNHAYNRPGTIIQHLFGNLTIDENYETAKDNIISGFNTHYREPPKAKIPKKYGRSTTL